MFLCKCGKLISLRFVVLYTFFIFMRKAFVILFNKLGSFEDSLFTMLLMFIGELLVGGVCSFIIEYKKCMNVNVESFLLVPLFHSKKEPYHGKSTKVFIFLISAFLDLCSFFFQNFLTREFNNNKDLSFLDTKLFSFQIIITSIVCYCLFKQKISLAQIFSLLFIIIGLAVFILVEYFFRNGIIFSDQLVSLIFLLLSYLIIGIQNCIEKYLMEYNDSSPFQILGYEGFFGIIFMVVIICLDFERMFTDIKYEGKSYALIIGFILYVLPSGFLNIYRLCLINDTSPTNIPTCNSFIMPLFFIYYFFKDKNHILDGGEIFDLIVNIIAFFMIIFGCLFYNEIILFNCQEEKSNTRKIERINDSVDQSKMDASFTTEGDDSY